MKGVSFAAALFILTIVALGQNDGTSVDRQRALANSYCNSCHNDQMKGGLGRRM